MQISIEIGYYALVLSLACAFIQIIFSILGSTLKDLTAINLSVRTAKVTFYLMTISYIVLALGFLNNDFSVKYILANSNAHLPWYFKISAAWAGHEGSLLLWGWILSFWGYLVAIKSKHLPPSFKAKVFGVLGVISLGFFAFILFTSSPFDRLFPFDSASPKEVSYGFPIIGRDLSPLLQDVGLIFHPPLLYMGYVGFAVSFAFIVAALLEGRLDTVWARWCRPWVISAWSFLTLGIVLGSWWAYYELGWGGWWFWDPVENASLMPWIAGTALLHSLASTEKRDVFKIWTAFLAITTFSLSLIGTFLVRSGVLTSVHAFASDPTRGAFILALIALISGSAYLILIFRVHKLKSTGKFNLISKETGLLSNNLILSLACLIVFIGTLSPLLFDVLNLKKISVGAPYFNLMMLPVFIVIVVFLSFAPFLNWKNGRFSNLIKPILISLALALVLSYFINNSYGSFNKLAFFLSTIVITSMIVTLIDIYKKIMIAKNKIPSKNYLAMFFGHFGFLISCLGIVITSTYSISLDGYVKKGDIIHLRDWSFEMKSIEKSKNKVYNATKVGFIAKNGDYTKSIFSENRKYKVRGMPMSEAALISSLSKDIYVNLGNELSKDAWEVKFQIKPFIRWIWLGGLIMALAALFVIFDKRYSMKRLKNKLL